MKELNIEQMEEIQGSTNCFLVGAAAVGYAIGGLPGVLFGTGAGIWSAVSYCWNY